LKKEKQSEEYKGGLVYDVKLSKDEWSIYFV